MLKPFTIKQQLYLNWSSEVEDAVRKTQLPHLRAESGEIAVTLADTQSETIEDQFGEFRPRLEKLSTSLLQNEVHGPIVLSISIRAYEYIPEISFPSEFIEALARLGASLDVDIINMVENA